MASTNIGGIPVYSISSISGTPVTSMSSISGIPVCSLAGWPGCGGSSCTTVYYGYSDGRRNPPEQACIMDVIPYDYDSASNSLYLDGQCGSTYAPVGYYSDGAQLYFFDGNTLNDAGPCR